MSPLTQLLHLLSLIAPALVVGALLALLAPLLRFGARGRRSWLRQAALNALAGTLALLGGLWYFGHDAKMATYVAMLVLIAGVQFVGSGGWKR